MFLAPLGERLGEGALDPDKIRLPAGRQPPHPTSPPTVALMKAQQWGERSMNKKCESDSPEDAEGGRDAIPTEGKSLYRFGLITSSCS